MKWLIIFQVSLVYVKYTHWTFLSTNFRQQYISICINTCLHKYYKLERNLKFLGKCTNLISISIVVLFDSIIDTSYRKQMIFRDEIVFT